MNLRTSLFSTFAATLFPVASFAGGSVAYEDVRGMLPAEVRNHLEFAFEIGEVGDATRLGNHFGELGGSRIGPYYFTAKSKSRDGAACKIVIMTEASILDGKGKEVQDPAEAKELKESYQSYEVEFVKGEANENSRPRPEPRDPDDDPGEPAVKGNLSAAEAGDVVNEVRKVYSEVENMDLEFDGGQMKSDDEQSGEVVRGFSKDGDARKVTFNVAMGDHGGFGVDVYTDRRGRPSFILWEESYWSFDPNDSNKTIDTVTERRFYFSPQGQLAKALEKSYSGSGERELKENRDAAKNSDFNAKPFGVPGFYKSLSELVKCNDDRLKPIANELWAAQDRMIGH